VWATGANVLLADTTCYGGNGRNSTVSFAYCVSPPTSGGPALRSDSSTVLVMKRCLLYGGSAGGAYFPCPPATNGAAVEGGGVRVTRDCTLQGAAPGATLISNLPSLASPGVATRGQPVTLTFAGAPGTWLLTYLDAAHAHLALPGIDGPLLLTPAAVSIQLLAIGAAGTLPLTLPVPVDPALRDQMVYCQAVAIVLPAAVSLTNVGDLRIR
jgi:hypothetical protein